MENDNKHAYYAFISYKHKANAPWAKEDEDWAKTIYSQLTSWKIPTLIDAEQRIRKNDTRIKPIFRDQEEIHAGDNTTNILHRHLDISKSLIVICSRKMIQEQRDKRKKEQKRHNKSGDKAYIFEEIDYFLKNPNRTVILVWIDQTPFNKNDSNCIPPQFESSDLKVVEVNSYQKGLMNSRKKQVAAEVAASIFQSNKGLFWDYYKRKRRELVLISILISAVLFGILYTTWRGRNVNLAYRNTLEAQELLDNGDRYKAMSKVLKAYEAFSSADGLTNTMWKCLDSSQPLMSVDGYIEVNAAKQLYAIINDNKQVILYSTQSGEEVEKIDVNYVEQVKFSPDGTLIAFLSTYKTAIYSLSRHSYVSKISIGTKEYSNFMFGDNNSILLFYNDKKAHYKIYGTIDGKQLFQSMIYTQQDSTRWVSANYSFLNNDSLLLVYGKIAPLVETRSIITEADKKKMKWACKLYNTHRIDPERSHSPALYCEISLPDGIECIQAAPGADRMIVSSQDGLYVYWLKNYEYVIKKLSYPTPFINWSSELEETYKKQYPDWEKMRVSDIQFSPNAQFALLTINDFLRFSVKIGDNHWAKTTEYNCTNEDYTVFSEVNLDAQRAKSIGIGNKQEVVFLNPVEIKGHNLSITPRDDRYNFCNYTHRKPTNKLLLDYSVYKEGNLMVITETDLSSVWSFDKKSYVHSYLYLDKNLIGNQALARLNQNENLEVGSVSPSGKYAIVENQLNRRGSSSYSAVMIWDLEKDTSICDLSTFVDSDIKLNCNSGYYFSEDEMIIGLSCIVPIKGKTESWKSSYLIVDLKKQKTLFDRVQSMSYFNGSTFISKEILFIDKDDETIIYNIEKGKIITRISGECKKLNRDADNIIFEVRSPGQGYTLQSFDKNTNQITRLPFDKETYGKKFLHASQDGNYLLILEESMLQVASTKSGEILYKFPNIQVNQFNSHPFAYFTGDNNYLLYTKESSSGLTMVDMKTGKEIYSLERFHKIIKSQRQSTSILDAGKNDYRGVALSKQHIAVQSNKLVILDLHTGRIYAEFDLPLSANAGMHFSPNGKYLVVDNYLIDVEQRQCISMGIKENPIYITDKHIIYDDDYLPIATSKELYQAISNYKK